MDSGPPRDRGIAVSARSPPYAPNAGLIHPVQEFLMRSMRSAVLGLLALLVVVSPALGQEMEVVEGPGSANYQAATRWPPTS